jgi:uncharacterized membrane protein
MTNTTLSFIRSWRPTFLRSEIARLLAASSCFSCVLVLLRILHTGKPMFIWMIWNLFLAYVPYGLSTWLTLSSAKPSYRLASWRFRLPALIWLLFVPNTFYILTDLYHLIDCRDSRVPSWFDLSLIFSFAWNGLLLGVLSVRQMQKLLAPAIGDGWSRLFVYLVLMLSALGVYAGRYLRFNSWDVVTNPFGLMVDMGRLLIHPLQNQQAWGMIVCYTILLSFIYNMLKKLSQALC